MWSSVPVLLIANLLLPLVATADEDVAFAQLPKPVTQTLATRYPAAKWIGGRKVIEDKVTFYEINLQKGDTPVQVDILPNGKINRVVVDLDVKDLPKPVTSSILRRYPRATIKNAVTVYTVRGSKDVLDHYNVEIKTRDGDPHSIDVNTRSEIADDQLILD
jgi:hypothetical protein